jgi:pimeloyl-ACP methyl ester carboxylesterase
MISTDGEELLGVLSQPDQPVALCAVLLNAGALRHTGPNRMWVEIARRWAALGVPTVRIDLTGIGDSDGDAYALEDDEGFYTPRYVSQVRELLSAFTDRGLPARFVLAGLCSGAYWAFHAALEDERVRGALMINPRALIWDPSISGVRDARAARKALRLSSWGKILRGQITRERIGVVARGVGVALASLPGHLRTRAQGNSQSSDELGRALRRIATSEMDLLAVFTAEEPMFEELERDGDLQRMCALPNVRVESIPGPLTSHTLEPLALQHAVHALLDEALIRILREIKATEAVANGSERQMPIP